MQTHAACELTIRLWGVFEGVGCGSGAIELTGVALAVLAVVALAYLRN